MKPIKLIINAFGPYAEKVELDFTILNGRNIFAISGQTGAGKTTIFDAISFALFGESTGGRDVESLRSHHAEMSTLTYVELEFSSKGDIYKVLRHPTQIYYRKLKSGEIRQTEKKHSAQFIKNGESISEKPTDVNSKIESLLGLNSNQFKQIVMLPQGEFKKLLEAESKDKEKIFRNIFGTDKFKQIQENLKLESSKLQKSVEGQVKRREGVLISLDAGEDEKLNNLLINKNILEIISEFKKYIEQDRESQNFLEEKLKNIDEERKKLENEKIKSEENNKKIDLKEKVSIELKLLKDEKIEIDSKKNILNKGNKAKEIIPIENNLIKTKKDLELEERKLSENNKKSEAVKKEYNENEILLENAKEKSLEKDFLIQEKLKNEEKIKKYKIFNEKKLEVKKLELSLKSSNLSMKNTEDLVKDIRNQIENYNKELIELSKKEAIKQEKLNEHKSKKTIIEKLLKLYNEINSILNQLKNHSNEGKKSIDLEKKYKEVKEKYEYNDSLFRKAQAGILAETLEENSPCPVCGSLNHPNLAKKENNVLTEEEIKVLKQEYEKSKDCYDKEINRLKVQKAEINTSYEKSIKNLFNEIQKEIAFENQLSEKIDINKLGVIKEETVNLGKKLRSEDEKLKEELLILDREIGKQNILNENLNKSKENLKINEDNLKKLIEENKSLTAKLESENALLEDSKKVLEEGITEEILNSKQNEIEKKLDFISKNLEITTKAFNKSSEELTKIKSDIENNNSLIQKYSKEKEELQEDFKNNIENNEFKSIEEYEKSKLNNLIINNLEKEINSYESKLISKSDEFKKLEIDTKDLFKIEIEKIISSINEKEIEINELREKSKKVYSRLSSNEKNINEIIKINNLIQSDESKFEIIGKLSKLANGENEEKLSFERYVLASYFEDIIISANLRLDKMTNGRYALKRKSTKGKGAMQSGLELEVFDSYTGKERHVKTLSGGEGFKASLSLALGLADVIQAHAGGVEIETMFVDEGFGTLDSESLDNAISTLMDLQSLGRLVGVISHVRELKERVEAILEVNTTQTGSTAKFIIQ